ncbi:relaxase/mobilization nuclease domain-containing protein [Breznakibacter xylanolyticus]
MEAKVNGGVAELIDSNMLSQNARNLAKEFGMIRTLKPNLNKVVYHTALSINPQEHLSNEQFVEIGKEYLKEMGFANSQYAMYRHYDRDHAHIHIIANRIDFDGQVVSDKWDYKRSENIVRQLEQKHGLIRVPDSSKVQESGLSKGQVELFRRTHTIPVKKQLQMILMEAISTSSSIPELLQDLNQQGVEMKLHKNQNEQVFGVSFELEGICLKGSTLGKGYSWIQINKKLTDNYERNRRSSQEIHRGTETNSRWSDRENSKDQFEQYRGLKSGYNPDSKQFERTSEGFKTGNLIDSGTTNQINENSATAGSEYQCAYHQNGSSQEVEFYNRHQNDTNSNTDRINDWGNNILDFSSADVINNMDKDDDNLFLNRKKKKKRNRDLERGI